MPANGSLKSLAINDFCIGILKSSLRNITAADAMTETANTIQPKPVCDAFSNPFSSLVTDRMQIRPLGLALEFHSFILPFSSSYLIAGDHIPSDSAMPHDPGGEQRHVRSNRDPYQCAPRSKPQSSGGSHRMERRSEMSCFSQHKHTQQRLVD